MLNGSSSETKRILWFRRDLLVKDNPLLSLGAEVLPILIFKNMIQNEKNLKEPAVGLFAFGIARILYK
ncbi:MAG: hypothetical protein WC667_08210 [Sulfurimonas sp.]